MLLASNAGLSKVLCAEHECVLSYDSGEGQGPKLRDRSGHGNDGTVTGAAWAGMGRDRGLCFQGGPSHVTTPDSASLRLDQFTLALLLRPERQPIRRGAGSLRQVIGKAGEFWDTNNAFAIYLGTDMVFRGVVRYGAGKKDFYQVNSFPVEANAWCHVALTRSNDTLALHVNGIPEGSAEDASRPTWTTSQSIHIGGLPTRPFAGLVTSVQIWNFAKTARQIAQDVRDIPQVDFWEDLDAPTLSVAPSHVQPVGKGFKKPSHTDTCVVMVTSMDVRRFHRYPLLAIDAEAMQHLNSSP